MDYDQRLQQEVEALRTRTALEMEQLKTQTREMFERENRYELTTVSPSTNSPTFKRGMRIRHGL